MTGKLLMSLLSSSPHSITGHIFGFPPVVGSIFSLARAIQNAHTHRHKTIKMCWQDRQAVQCRSTD